MKRKSKGMIKHDFVIIKKASIEGITLVALVITIIILLILAGITLSLTVGKNGIIRRAQEAGRNYQNAAEYERIALDELMNTTDSMINDVTNNDKKPYDESEFRKLIAQAITKEGVSTTWEDSDAIFVENIGRILQERTKNATATAGDIAQGKTAWVNGEEIIGTGKEVENAYNKGYSEGMANAQSSQKVEYVYHSHTDACYGNVQTVCTGNRIVYGTGSGSDFYYGDWRCDKCGDTGRYFESLSIYESNPIYKNQNLGVHGQISGRGLVCGKTNQTIESAVIIFGE